MGPGVGQGQRQLAGWVLTLAKALRLQLTLDGADGTERGYSRFPSQVGASRRASTREKGRGES